MCSATYVINIFAEHLDPWRLNSLEKIETTRLGCNIIMKLGTNCPENDKLWCSTVSTAHNKS